MVNRKIVKQLIKHVVNTIKKNTNSSEQHINMLITIAEKGTK